MEEKIRKWQLCFLTQYVLKYRCHKPYNDDEDMVYQIPDTSEPYNEVLMLNIYLIGLLKQTLKPYKEYEVLNNELWFRLVRKQIR